MALRRLNMLVKQWQGNSDLAPGLKIHTRQRVTLFLAVGQQNYLVGPASTDARATTQYGRTTVSSAYASGTSLSVTALTDTTTYPGTTVTMTASDIIGVELNDGTIGWTTISAAASSPITLAAGLGGAAAAGKYVWWFTSRAQRFPLIESAVLRNSSLDDTPLAVYTDVRDYELGIADKYSDGQPSAILVEPLRIATRVICNSQPTDITSQVLMTVLYPAEDYDATSDDIAFPQEWFAALSWELALRLAPAKGRPWTPEMDMNHKTALAMARSVNPENCTLYFQGSGVI
ncbi:MAG TPA: hypothetical protein VGK99_05415 [Acidobacteriota bacterium]|jgi:hypothetical protein